MTAVILRTHKAVELVVIEVNEFFLELRRLGFKPLAESVAYLVNLGVGKLYRLVVRHLYVVAVIVLAD